MKGIIITLGILATYAGAMAGNVKQSAISCTISTNAATPVTNTLDGVQGWVHEIKIDMTSADTGAVSVAAVPADTTFAAVTLATDATLSAEGIFRPRFDGTTTDGTGNTDDPPEMYMCAGDTIRFVVTGTTTGTTYKALVKWINTK